MLKLINASNWQVLSLGDITYYSPNADLLAGLVHQQNEEFWKTHYSEFACVIVNKSNHTLQLVRDHFGCEPFFYYLNADCLYFASSIVDLILRLKSVGINPRINELELPYLLWTSKRVDMAASIHEDTIYENIKRVKPNRVLTLRDYHLTQEQYWDLATRSEDKIYYRDDREYLEHFTELLHEGICLQLGDESALAAECSGGLDSSSIILAAHQLGKPLSLFTHQDLDSTPMSSRLRESYFIDQILQKTNFEQHVINADNFNLPQVLQLVSNVLAGFPHNLFPIGANNIHERVAESKAKILLSGFGGDECVSGHASLSRALFEWLKNGRYASAWSEYHNYYQVNKANHPRLLRQLKDFALAKFPQISQVREHQRYLDQLRQSQRFGLDLPTYVARAKTVAEHEIMLLIGARNNHLSCRIEDSALMARHYGFKYKYPFLYPKLVEFCNRLPLHLKRRNGLSRIMVRDYLAKANLTDFKTKPIAKYDGNIMGSTLKQMLANYRSDFASQLNSALPHADVQQRCLKFDPKLAETILMYQTLAGLSLEMYRSEWLA
ncbi:MAG: hypothetical protein K2Y14_07125 [Burkholderiales bacterium]|nr:hypothetical protein [Burkholderiales bacterium]